MKVTAFMILVLYHNSDHCKGQFYCGLTSCYTMQCRVCSMAYRVGVSWRMGHITWAFKHHSLHAFVLYSAHCTHESVLSVLYANHWTQNSADRKLCRANCIVWGRQSEYLHIWCDKSQISDVTTCHILLHLDFMPVGCQFFTKLLNWNLKFSMFFIILESLCYCILEIW